MLNALRIIGLLILIGLSVNPTTSAQSTTLDMLKEEVRKDVESRKEFTRQMVDQIFSYGELGFQETETSRYLVDLLRENGFKVEEGIAGIPTAWLATWGEGKPVISLGTDIDDIPQASQFPGVACHLPMVDGAPGHGEGHNSGQAVNITAALAVKEIMQRENLSGTIQLWPGVAEELLGTKAYYVREGLFEDVDIVLYNHVGSNLTVDWGITPGTGMISAIYSFEGASAHAGGRPWQGRSAADAVQLMEVGWNFRREHLRPEQRSHSVVVFGGDQPNVVPQRASIWFYFRELDYDHIQELFGIGNEIAAAAAMMTNTSLAPIQILGSAWPGHFNRPLAENVYKNIEAVGLPDWSADDQALARAVQRLVGSEEKGLASEIRGLRTEARQDADRRAGFADDIGDISWNVPTIVLGFPSNIEGLPGHNWANAIAMATPIAHKGATAGAKVQAMTMLDILYKPELIENAWKYFTEEQTKHTKYTPLIRPEDTPAIDKNRETMARFRPQMREYYYDSSKYDSYLEQLGVNYPVLPAEDGECTLF
jgi:aminobenzoyl-glutamate utilization protein B